VFTKSTLSVTVVIAGLFGALPAQGQGLSDAIAEVRRQQAMEEAAKAELSPRQKILQKLFYQDLTVAFQETQARDVFEYLKTALDINLIARYADDAAGHGIDPQTPITLEAEDMPAIDVLEQVLDQCAVIEPCTWQLRSSYLEVGTKERLASDAAKSVRVYPVSDLLMEPPDFYDAPSILLHDRHHYGGPLYGNGFLTGGGLHGLHGGVLSGGYGGSISVGRPGPARPAPARRDEEAAAEELIEAIVNIVEPTGWSRSGGSWATIKHTRGALIVRAPDFIQRQLFGYPKVPPPMKNRAEDAKEAGEKDDADSADG